MFDIITDNARRLEARAVADRIKLLLLQGQVVDKKTKEYRPVQYKDIVILTRSIKGWADVFAQVLAEEGISAHVGSREGYFETYEVSVLLDYLQILDNERQDLPLAAVLTSPFAGLDARELAKIRSMINADLSYTPQLRRESDLTLALVYNVQGPRIETVGIYGTGNIKQQTLHTMDFIASYAINKHLSLRL